MVLAGKVNEGISELLSAKWADYNTQLYHQMFLKHKQLDLRVTEDRLLVSSYPLVVQAFNVVLTL